MATSGLEMIPLNDLKRGFLALRPHLRDAAVRVMESGHYVHGPEHQAFEAEFGEYIGTGACAGVANGTDALELALRALDPEPGSVAVTVANAAMYATTAARRAGLRVRYVDVDPDSLLMDASDLERVLDDDVSVVVVTHLYGRLAEIERVVDVCRTRGVLVLEDCAQATGARRGFAKAGSFGDAAAFSYYPTKNLGALGDGGAVVSRHEEVVERARQLRQYGWAAKYEVALDGGRNSRLDEMQAAMLRVRLPYLDSWNARRRTILDRYGAAAYGTVVRVLPSTGEDHVGHLAVALTERRAAVRQRLFAEGVATDIHYPVPDHRQKSMEAEFESTRLPVTEQVSEQVFTLPCFPELTETEVDRVCYALAGI